VNQNDRINGTLDRELVNEGRVFLARVAELSRLMDEWSNEGMIIEQIVMQGPEKTHDGFRAIIKGIDEARNRYVAFRSGGSVREVMAKIVTDAESGRLVFKEELPWNPEDAKKTAKGNGKE